MRRRDFIVAAGAISGLRLAMQSSWAQPVSGSRRPLIGILDLTDSATEHSSGIASFLAALADLGYVDGRTATIEPRYAGGNTAALPSIAAELARLKPDIVVCDTASAIKATEAAMPDTPIVGITMSYPVEQKLIASFAHPGGNLTGLASAVEELDTKLLDLSLRAVRAVKSIGLLMNPNASLSEIERRAYESAARARGLGFHAAAAGTLEKIPDAISSLVDAGAQLLVVQENGMFFLARHQIGPLAITRGIPVISSQSAGLIEQTGYLLTYGIDADSTYRRAASFVDRILKGAKPSDLPVEFPAKLVMSVNLKTAQALGLQLPQELLNIADHVVE